MKTLEGLSVVIPAYNEDDKLLNKLKHKLDKRGAEVIIVDDGSDPPVRPTIVKVRHMTNGGYGIALKDGIRKATNPVVCTMDGDGEHTVDDVEKIYITFKLITNCAMIVGCRWNLNERPIRWFGRKTINFIASCWAKHLMVDLNSGMRIFKKELALGYEPILCDTFSFTTSLTMALVTDGHKIAWFPIDVMPRLYGKSKVNLVRDGIITMKYVFWIGFALRTRSLRSTIRRWLRKDTA